MTATCHADRDTPGTLRLVMDGLAGSGLDARPTGHDEAARLEIAWPGARCTAELSDCGQAELQWCPVPPQEADPGFTADLATMLLTGRSGRRAAPGAGGQLRGMTFKGLVGLELKARGLDVELAVYSDEGAFDVFAEVVATVPGGDARVIVSDDGSLTWIREYWTDAGPAGCGPGSPGPLAGPAVVAGSVVGAVTRAMSLLRPAGTRRAGQE